MYNTQQILPATPVAAVDPASAKKMTQGKLGRKKESKNKNLKEVECTYLQSMLRDAIKILIDLIGPKFPLIYLLYDGALGHNTGVQLALQMGLHLISKLRYDAELYLPC